MPPRRALRTRAGAFARASRLAWAASLACLASCSLLADWDALEGVPGASQDASVSDAASQPRSDAQANEDDAARTGDAAGADGAVADASGSFMLPPTDVLWDCQLEGVYQPAADVAVVARQRFAGPDSRAYSICYVAGFHADLSDPGFWSAHADLYLRDGADVVVDAETNFPLLDVRTPTQREAIADLLQTQLVDCAERGFAAIQLDGLEAYSESRGLISADDAVAMMRVYSTRAHALGLAIGQQNAVELAGRKVAMGTDFAVSESCNRYAECDLLELGYGGRVYVVEYRRADFDAACARAHTPTVLRDNALRGPGEPGYVYAQCP